MKIGDHMQPVVALVDELTGDKEAAVKLLSMIIAEYMLNLDTTECEVSTGILTITTTIDMEVE